MLSRTLTPGRSASADTASEPSIDRIPHGTNHSIQTPGLGM